LVNIMPDPRFWFVVLGLIWGTNFFFMKLAATVVDPLQVVWVRVVAGALPIVAWAALRGELRLRDLRHAHHFVAMALLANVLPFYFLVRGTQLLTSGIAGVISGAIPLFTAVLALLFVPDERLGRYKVAGLVLGFGGVLAVAEAWTRIGAVRDGSLAGEGFILAGALSYAVAFVYAKRHVSPLGLRSTSLAAYQTAFAAILLTCVTDLGGVGRLVAHPSALVAAGLGLGLVGTGVAYIIYYYIIDRLGAVAASSVTYIPPVVALAIGVGLLHDLVSVWQWMGAALILAGIHFARKGPMHEAPQQELT
jgi:drug/metabolite transporter (DMT)-like permease